ESRVRMVALEVLLDVWKLNTDPDLFNVCERLAMEDIDVEVRAMALIGLGTCYNQTHDARIGLFLSQIVKNDSLDVQLSEAAYHSLFALCGELNSWVEINLKGFHIPDDIDWTFVEKFVSEKKGT